MTRMQIQYKFAAIIAAHMKRKEWIKRDWDLAGALLDSITPEDQNWRKTE